MIPENIKKEWNEHLSHWKTALGTPRFISKAAYMLMELSSTLSRYALGTALKENPPVGLPFLFSDFIQAYMFAKYVLEDYIENEGRKKLFIEWFEKELDESKENLQKVIDLHNRNYWNK